MWSAETLEWIDIELTSFCNIKCKGCFRVLSNEAEKILNKKYIDLETIKKRFQKFMFPNLKVVNFCGSVDEPTTHPQFFEIVEHFSDWNVHINVATNGSLKTVSWWRQLAQILPSSHRVTWGIDGIDETSEIYREGSSFAKVQENFRSFIAAQGKAVWQFIEFEHNMHQTEQAKQIAKDEGFKDFKLIISHRKDTGNIKHVKVENQESSCISCKYSNQKRIFINHMGNVIPCCHLNSKMLEFAVNGKQKDKFEDILLDSNYTNDINLANVNIETALQGKVFTSIIDSWNSNSKISKCVSFCKLNNRDKFIKEKLF